MSRRTMTVLALLCLAVTLAAAALGRHLLRPPRAADFANEYAALRAHALGEGVVYLAWNGDAEGGRVRVGVQKSGGAQYLYELPADGRFLAFALTEGDGDYTVTVYQHIADKRYRPVFSQALTLALTSPDAPFLRPNRMVDYVESGAVAALAQELTAGLTGDCAVLDALSDYVATHCFYDEMWAETIQSGYTPEVEEVLARGGGNCLDLSALLCAMLRLRAVPCKLAVGWAGDVYHAWLYVFIDGEWVLRDPTFQLGGALDFIKTPENYCQEFIY